MFRRGTSLVGDRIGLLRELAAFPRDYLLPAPEKNFAGCRQLELRYEIGYAVQNRVMALLVHDGRPLFSQFLCGPSGRRIAVELFFRAHVQL